MIEGISFSLQGVLVLTIAMGSMKSTDLSHTERMSVRIRKSVMKSPFFHRIQS